ncbi:MAG: IS200/IS605 family transposase [Brasilonema octagenarum HA4186-MV1]|jgi:putative transposase|uniref:IS200/IS605 family transposase n=2 Tax=Brasilonema TaxID=383614 RepID=A0A856MLY6_9CYAN|nr:MULTISPECIES: IS200/IS605 family transposase [Brasilonema]MBW4628176.1 IS200/IS605 family transposase [Brasilonema octagenarum HA4186-MV1]NMF66915.1 IS200/IS605 family transposase [Brasilonema octagenarum UFV-OR1]QDL10551.1 IS200/IS605 family transposase [Brasilonema sennae CENA114]QDL16895.1 IS200/IS605 family transposase [Brasilonema octagenarum UFV-E1]
MLKASEYKSGNHNKYLLNLHYVWCPKRRKKVLIGDVARRAKEIFYILANEKGWDILALEVAPDHIHLFIGVTPSDAPHLVIKAFKGRSSYYLRKEFPELLKLPSLWSRSYFVSSAGNVSSEVIKKYIEDQHHG